MHICYVLGAFPTTSETFISDEIVSLTKVGHKVTIARISRGTAANHANVTWIKENLKIVDIELPTGTTESLSLLLDICLKRRTIRPLNALLTHHPRWSITAMLPTFLGLLNDRFDHIHAHFADKQALLAHALAELMDVPFSFTMHGYDIRELPIGIDNLLLVTKAAKCVFTVSDANITSLKSHGINTDKFEVIPCGIDTSKFSMSSNPYDGGQLIISCVARLHPIKNHMTLLKALSMGDLNVDFKLKLIGDGEMKDDLVDFVNNNSNLKQRVSFLGALASEQVLKELQCSHVHVLPSFNEGMPVANTEAMATGLVCIASNVGGLPEAIQHGKNGFLFDPQHPDQLKNTIEDIYFGKIDARRISMNARAQTLAKFDQIKLIQLKLDKMLS